MSFVMPPALVEE